MGLLKVIQPPTWNGTIANTRSGQRWICLAESWKYPRTKFPQPLWITSSNQHLPPGEEFFQCPVRSLWPTICDHCPLLGSLALPTRVWFCCPCNSSSHSCWLLLGCPFASSSSDQPSSDASPSPHVCCCLSIWLFWCPSTGALQLLSWTWDKKTETVFCSQPAGRIPPNVTQYEISLIHNEGSVAHLWFGLHCNPQVPFIRQKVLGFVPLQDTQAKSNKIQ